MFFKPVPSVKWSEINATDTIIDVREPDEYKVHHVPNAINIPLSHIAGFNTTQRVYVVCASGMRSKKAVKILRKKGIDALNIKGGMMHYGK